MPFDSIIWDLDDDPEGNVQHCAEHGEHETHHPQPAAYA